MPHHADDVINLIHDLQQPFHEQSVIMARAARRAGDHTLAMAPMAA